MEGAKEADRIVRLKEVLVITGLSRAVVYRLCSQGAFPAQVDSGAKHATWRYSDVQAWIASRRKGGGMKRRRVCTPADMAGMLDSMIAHLERNIGIKAAPETSPEAPVVTEPTALAVKRTIPAVDSGARDPSREELETEFHKGFSADSAAGRTLISDMRVAFGAIRGAVERGDQDGVRSALKLAELALGEASV